MGGDREINRGPPFSHYFFACAHKLKDDHHHNHNKGEHKNEVRGDDVLFTCLGAVGFNSIRLVFEHIMFYKPCTEEKALLYC